MLFVEGSEAQNLIPTIIHHLGFYNKNDHFEHSALNSRKKVIKESSNRNAPCNRIFFRLHLTTGLITSLKCSNYMIKIKTNRRMLFSVINSKISTDMAGKEERGRGTWKNYVKFLSRTPIVSCSGFWELNGCELYSEIAAAICST